MGNEPAGVQAPRSAVHFLKQEPQASCLTSPLLSSGRCRESGQYLCSKTLTGSEEVNGSSRRSRSQSLERGLTNYTAARRKCVGRWSLGTCL